MNLKTWKKTFSVGLANSDLDTPHSYTGRSRLDLDVMTLTIGEQSRERPANAKRVRRTKESVGQADKKFICGCGKVYLSYAALYTHTKVKHNGRFVEGTDLGEKKKQGRPRVATTLTAETDHRIRPHREEDRKEAEVLRTEVRRAIRPTGVRPSRKSSLGSPRGTAVEERLDDRALGSDEDHLREVLQDIAGEAGVSAVRQGVPDETLGEV